MKLIKKLALFVFFVFLLLSNNFKTTCFAETEQNNEIVVEVNTDKQQYVTDDEIEIDVKVYNHSECDLKDVTLTIQLPEEIDGVAENGYKIDSIKSNNVWEHKFEGVITIENNILPLVICFCVILTLIILFSIKNKNKFAKKSLILLMVLTCLVSTYTYDVVAEEIKMPFEVSETKIIKIGNKEKEIKVISKGYVSTKEDDIKLDNNDNNLILDADKPIINNKENVDNGNKNSAYNDVLDNGNNADNVGKITIKYDENPIKIDRETITINGLASDDDGIKRIEYTIDDLAGKVVSGNASGKENWTFTEKVEVGTSEVNVCMYDLKDNKTCDEVRIVRTSNEFMLEEEVEPLTVEEANDFWDYFCLMLYNSVNKENFYLIFLNDGFIKNNIDRLKSSILHVPGIPSVPAGFTGKVLGSYLPSELVEMGTVEELDLSIYNDEDYIALEFTYPTIDELFANDICINIEEKEITSDDISFVVDRTGNLIYSKNQTSTTWARRSNNSVNVPIKIGLLPIDLTIPINDNSSIKIKGSIGLENLSISAGFEKKEDEINYRQLYIETKRNESINLDIDFSYNGDLKDVVSKINGGSKKYKNEVPLYNNITLTGVEMNEEIVLYTVGISLVSNNVITKAGVGHLDGLATISSSPLVLVNLVLNLNGEIEAKINTSFDYTKTVEDGLGIRKKTFSESLFSWDSWNDRIRGDFIGAEFDVKAYSKDEKVVTNKTEVSINANCSGNIDVGPGITNALMIFGLVPLKLGIKAVGSLEANFAEFSFKWDDKNDKWNFEKELGKVDSSIKIILTPSARLGVKKEGVIDQSLSFELFKPIVLKEFKRDIKPASLSIQVFNNETDKKPVDNHYRIYLDNVNTNGQIYTYDLRNGNITIPNIDDFGEYTLKLLDTNTNTIVYEINGIKIKEGIKRNEVIYLGIYDTEEEPTPTPTPGQGSLLLSVYDNPIDKNIVENYKYLSFITNVDTNKKYAIKIEDGLAHFTFEGLLGRYLIEIRDIINQETIYSNDYVVIEEGKETNKTIYLSPESDDENYPILTLKNGEYFYLGKYNDEDILWRIVGRDENGLLVVSDKILSLKSFDAKGDSEEYHKVNSLYYQTVRMDRGSNCWAESNLRQWLNSAEETVSWTHNPPNDDNVFESANSYDDESGFLSSYNFTSEELSIIKDVTRKVYVNSAEKARNKIDGGTYEHEVRLDYKIKDQITNYDNMIYMNVTDKMFILDLEQLLMIHENLGEDYLSAYPTESAVELNEYLIDGLSTHEKWLSWINHPSTNGASYEISTYLDKEAIVRSTPSYDTRVGIRPGFYLKDDVKFVDGDGSINDPYIIR